MIINHIIYMEILERSLSEQHVYSSEMVGPAPTVEVDAEELDESVEADGSVLETEVNTEEETEETEVSADPEEEEAL